MFFDIGVDNAEKIYSIVFDEHTVIANAVAKSGRSCVGTDNVAYIKAFDEEIDL